MQAADMSTVYFVPGKDSQIWSEWDDAAVVYDVRSGHTQVLNDFARELLALFEDGPKNLNALIFEFEKIIEKPVDDNTKQQIIDTVSNFDKMGLIEPL